MKKVFKYINSLNLVCVLFFSLVTQLSNVSNGQNRIVVPKGTQISDGSTVNSLDPLTFSVLDLSSIEKGFLLPRLTTNERSAIPETDLVPGLVIYNTTMGCIEFYNVTRKEWMNMCGDVEPATFSITDAKCNDIKISGDYIKGIVLNERKNLLTLEVNVSNPGSFTIEAIAFDDTGVENGYSFSTKGVFPTAGNFLLVLKGQGKPKKGYSDVNTKDVIKFYLNKKLVTCTVRNHVKPDFEPLEIAFICNDSSHPITAEGSYKEEDKLTNPKNSL